ncbi:MAG: polyamine aminopropyltransferase [Gammaproteobacteria bacterium]|nr:polyamine aminopropyltransferase [Gammaproteobacteria bacterium]
MHKLDENQWVSDVWPDLGTAFSLKISAKLHEEQSPFQRIAVYETSHFGRLMTIDGIIMLTDRDNFHYHEMLAHPALYNHPAPRNVVIIGGGDCGTLKEVLKHDEVESVIQIDIDERVTRVAEEYFPALCESNGDPRATLAFIDGIRWMAEAPAESVDLIIVDSTDPVGPAEGLFNVDFYRNCRRVLRSGGILVQQSEAPFLQLPWLLDIRAAMAEAGFMSRKTLSFPQPVYPSGFYSATLAGKDHDLGFFREADARAKPFVTEYYNAGIHRASAVLPEFLKRALD